MNGVKSLIKELRDDRYELEIKFVITRLKSKRKDDVTVSTFKQTKKCIFSIRVANNFNRNIKKKKKNTE